MNLTPEVDRPTRKGTQSSAQWNWLTAQGPPVIVGVAFLLYAARLFRLISRYAVNIFFLDQWDFNDATLFQKHSLWQMFAWQHGPHRQGLASLFAKLVEPLFNWNSRVDSFIVGVIVATAAVCALWLKKRLYGRLFLGDVVIPAIFFTPAQWETVFVTSNLAHGSFPLLLIVLYCLGWTCSRSIVKYPLLLLINFVTIYTGFGLFLGVLTPILLVLDYRASSLETRLPRTYFVSALIMSLASLGSFFIGYKFNAALDCFSFQPQSPVSYMAFITIMFANFFDVKGVGAVPWIVGITILIAMLACLATAVWQLLRRQNLNLPNPDHSRPLVTTALIAYCLLFCLNTAYGRLCAGLWTAHSPRYVIYLEIGVLGLYFHLLSIHWPLGRKLLLTVLLVPLLVAYLRIDRREMERFRNVKQRWKTCYLQIEDIEKCDQSVGVPLYSNPPEATHLQEKLLYLKRTRQNLYSDSR
jgi:hypothetical protein